MFKNKIKHFLWICFCTLCCASFSATCLVSCSNQDSPLEIKKLDLQYSINKTTFLNNETIEIKAIISNHNQNNDYKGFWYLINLSTNKNIKLMANEQIMITNDDISSTITFKPNFFKEPGKYQIQYKLLNNNNENILEDLKQVFEIQIKHEDILPNPDDNENILDSNFVYHNILTLNQQYYLNQIKSIFDKLKNGSKEVILNYEKLGKLFATFISYLAILVKNNLCAANTPIDMQALNWDLNLTNKIMIVAESKYFNSMLNFSITENLTLNFNKNKFQSLTISDIPKAYSSRVYEILLSKFIFNCLNEVTNEMNDFEKIVAVSKYIVNYVIYHDVSNGISTTNNFFDTINNRISACRNFASLLSIILNILEIPNFTSCGNLYTNNGTINLGLHMWNHVMIDNHWYVIDLTSLDANTKQPTAIYQGGRRLKFDPNFFLIGKDDNYNLKYDNLVLPSQVGNNYFQSKSAYENLDQNLNKNATFIYQDLWNKNSYKTILKDLFKNDKNLFDIQYWNGYWYIFNKENNDYYLYQLNLKNNKIMNQWIFNKSKYDFLANSSIGFNNFYFVYNYQTNKYGYFNLNDCINSKLPTFNEIKCQLKNPNPLTSKFIRIKNTIYEEYNHQLFVLIKDINKLNGNQIKPNYLISTNGWNAIGQLWQSISNIGTGQNQIDMSNYSSINSQLDLVNFIKQIHWTKPKLEIRQDLPNTLIINPNYFNQIIKNEIFDYQFKLSFLVSYQPSIYLNEFEDIDYLWFHNNQLISYNQEFIKNISIKNIDDLNKLIGVWKCVAIDKATNQKIISQTLIIKLDNQYSNKTFYPDYLSLKNLSNSINEPNLSIQTNFGIMIYPDIKAQYDILFNNQVIFSHTLLNNEPINYFKDTNEMKDNEYGLYQIKITFENSKNKNDKLIWLSPTYYMFKIIN